MQRKPGIPFLGWTPCLFPSKNCRFEKYMEMMKGGRWFKKTFFQLSKNDPSSFKTNYVCLPTPGAPLESSGSFGLWLLSLSISLLACSWSSVSISSFSSSVFSAFSSSSASDFWDLLLSDSSASDFWDLLLSDVISPSLVSSEASSLIPAEANLAWKKNAQLVMFYVKLIILLLVFFIKKKFANVLRTEVRGDFNIHRTKYF